MSNTIQLDPIEADVTGWGPDYYRRKQEPTEPYYVENLNFDETVRKEYPHRDFEMEQYLVNQAVRRGIDPKRPFQKTLRGLDWSRGSDKIRTEYWDPKGVARSPDQESGHYDYVGYYQKHQDTTKEPIVRMFGDTKKAPYTHEFSHHLYNFQDNPSDPRRMVNIPEPGSAIGNPNENMDEWRSTPSEVQAEASQAKRDYTHRTVSNRKSQLGYYDYPEAEDREAVLRNYKNYYGVEPFDKDHPAVEKELHPYIRREPIPDEIIDDMFETWMQRDPHGWGESYRDKPEEFPVELFKEALRLGQNNQKPAGLFTGRGPQNA